MKFDVLHNFISPVSGKIKAEEDYILLGDSNEWTFSSPILIDTRLDIISLRKKLNNVSNNAIAGLSKSVKNAVLVFEGEDGKTIKQAGGDNNTVTIDDSGVLEAKELLVKNASGQKTGFVAPLLSDNSVYQLPLVDGFPTQVLAIAGPPISGKTPTFWMTLPRRIRRRPRPPFTPIVPVPIWIGNPEPTPIPIPEKAPPVENSIPALDKAGGEIVDTPAQVDPISGDISTTGSLNSGGSISSGSSTSIGSVSSIGSSGSAGSGGTGGIGGIASSIGGLGGSAGAAGLGGLGGAGASGVIAGGAGGLGIGGATAGGLGGAVSISGGLGGVGGNSTTPATGGLGSAITVGSGIGIGATGGALIIEGVKRAKRTGVIISGGDDDDNSSIVVQDDEETITIGGEAGSGNLALTGNISAKGDVGGRGLNLQELDNEHKVNIQPPMNLAASYSVILPTESGKEGQVLTQGADSKWTWKDNTGGGTVTSVGITASEGITVTKSPITQSGNINLDLNNIPANKIKNYPSNDTKYLDGSGNWTVPQGGNIPELDEDIYILLQLLNDEVL